LIVQSENVHPKPVAFSGLNPRPRRYTPRAAGEEIISGGPGARTSQRRYNSRRGSNSLSFGFFEISAASIPAMFRLEREKTSRADGKNLW